MMSKSADFIERAFGTPPPGIEAPESPHIPEEPMGGRLPQARGPYIFGTDSRAPYNGTSTIIVGTDTAYFWHRD